MHCTVLHYTAQSALLSCIAVHCTTLHCTTLHCTGCPPDRGWVGWKSDKRQSVEITFEFDSPRQIHSVQLYCNNQFTR